MRERGKDSCCLGAVGPDLLLKTEQVLGAALREVSILIPAISGESEQNAHHDDEELSRSPPGGLQALA